MTHRFARLRRFHFNLPQRIAAGMLLLFLAQGLWLTSRQTLSDRDYQYARCGREMWERPAALSGYFTTCGNIRDGVLAYRVAGTDDPDWYARQLAVTPLDFEVIGSPALVQATEDLAARLVKAAGSSDTTGGRGAHR